MSVNYLIKKCLLKPSEGSALKEEFSLLNGNPNISYHESILTPSLALSVDFFDADGVVSREGLSGGEYIEIEVTTADTGLDDFRIGPEHKMIINGVKNVITSNKGQAATLEAVSEEVLVNETARISKKYSANIADMVKEILKDDKKGITTSKELDQEQSGNKYSFVGNYRKPFDIIQWLQPKAGKDSKIFGFLFWENLDGYHFKSLDTLLEEDPDDKDGYPKVELPEETAHKILEDQASINSDIVMNLQRGMYCNKTIYVDLLTGVKSVVDFSIQDLKIDRPPKLPKGIETKPTKLMFRILDQGALQEDSKKDKVEKSQDLARYQNKSYARNNLIFAQALSISVPFNPNLRAGKTIEVKFPFNPKPSKEDRTLGKDGDNDPSGKYLIAEMKHDIRNGNANTQLSLIRNVFTPTA